MPMTSRLASSERNGLGLDRGGGDVAFFGEGAEDRLCEAEFVKGVQFRDLSISGRAASQACERTRNAGFKTSRVARAVGVEKRKAGRKP